MYDGKKRIIKYRGHKDSNRWRRKVTEYKYLKQNILIRNWQYFGWRDGFKQFVIFPKISKNIGVPKMAEYVLKQIKRWSLVENERHYIKKQLYINKINFSTPFDLKFHFSVYSDAAVHSKWKGIRNIYVNSLLDSFCNYLSFDDLFNKKR